MDFSLLMSVYRKEDPAYLKESLDSIFAQTVRPSQIVMVEDGPLTPELYEALEPYKADPCYKAVPLKENVGLGKALNAGLEACDYPLVARMDTDDIAFPDRFEKQLACFEADPELDICGSYCLEFDGTTDNVVSKKEVPLTHEEIYAYAKRRNPFSHGTVMYKKEAVEKAGSYQHAMWFEDYYLWARMLVNGAKAKNIAEPLLYFRASSDMFERRGGMKYFKSAAQVKYKIYKMGLSGLGDFLYSTAAQGAVSLMPNKMRAAVYKRFLRKERGQADE